MVTLLIMIDKSRLALKILSLYIYIYKILKVFINIIVTNLLNRNTIR